MLSSQFKISVMETDGNSSLFWIFLMLQTIKTDSDIVYAKTEFRFGIVEVKNI